MLERVGSLRPPKIVGSGQWAVNLSLRRAVVNFDHLSESYFYGLNAQLQRLARQVIVVESEKFIDRTQSAGSGWNLSQLRIVPRIAFDVASRDDAFDVFQARPLRQ